VGKLVSVAAQKKVALNELEPQEFLDAAPFLTPQLVQETFDVRSALAARRASGAPSEGNVAQRLAHWRRVLA
jgi:argininosuccinate lyase